MAFDDENIPEFYDEDAIYNAEPEDLLPDVPFSELSLYRETRTDRDGAVKTHFKGNGSGRLIYSRDKPDYALTVERLVWFDGWRKTTGDGAQKEHHGEMTLVVLKFVFAAKTPDSKVSFASVDLRFKSEDKGGYDPEVVAWGPFRRQETWNTSVAQRKVNVKAEGRLGIGAAGQEISAALTAENETSWEQVDFECGSSSKLWNFKKERTLPNGVSWKIKQNQLYKRGITPEFRIAVLLSRRSSQPYLVDFCIRAHTGVFSENTDAVMRLVGLPGGNSVFWRATPCPGQEDSCHGDGRYIVRSIDTDNMETLISEPPDNESLKADWLDIGYRFEVEQAKPNPENKPEPATSKQEGVVVAGALEEAATSDTHGRTITLNHIPEGKWQPDGDLSEHTQQSGSAKGPPNLSSQANGTRTAAGGINAQPRVHDLHVGVFPGLQIPTTSPPSIEYNRLLWLETRAAQADLRIASQDQLIFQLQQALAKMEQALHAVVN